MVTEVLQAFLDRAARPVVMFVDVDRFKLINDGIGHGAGDTILVLLGERLKNSSGLPTPWAGSAATNSW